jgi:Rps23 Pro-64 3,4-dihydroxylase Tpa1-like proline 4-hydroxylase
MLNPELDRKQLAAQWAAEGRVRIENIFDADVAERIHNTMKTKVPFRFVFHVDGKSETRTQQEMTSMSPEEARELHNKLMRGAARGIGFFYCGYMIGHRDDETGDEDLEFLNSIFDYVNGEEMMSFVSEITGYDDLKSAAAQYTRYTVGQFLTRHRDETENKRRLAFVFGFTRNWHPDWGGLLQFYEEDGTPRDAWTPAFNTVSMFDIRHIHSVTYVAPYALEPRLSLTGWFRAKPL